MKDQTKHVYISLPFSFCYLIRDPEKREKNMILCFHMQLWFMMYSFPYFGYPWDLIPTMTFKNSDMLRNVNVYVY